MYFRLTNSGSFLQVTWQLPSPLQKLVSRRNYQRRYCVWRCNAGPRTAQVLQLSEGNLSCAPEIRDETQKYMQVKVTQEASFNPQLDLLRPGHSGLTTAPLLGHSLASIHTLTCPSTEVNTTEDADKLLPPPTSQRRADECRLWINNQKWSHQVSS